jgi:PAS domain S-box-containing protein
MISRSQAELEAEILLLRQQLSALRAASEQRSVLEPELSLLFDNAPVLLWTMTSELVVKYTAGALASGDMTGSPFARHFTPVPSSVDPMSAAATALDGKVAHFNAQLGPVAVEAWMTPYIDPVTRRAGIAGIAIDDTARRTAESDALTAADRYRTLLDTNQEVLYAHDFEGAITSVSGNLGRLFGRTRQEALAMRFEDLLAHESRSQARQRLHALMAGMTPQTWEAAACGANGKRIDIEIRARLLLQDGRPVGIEGLARDISERKSLEEQARQAQKLDAIGVLAGGIAHDFNNLLTGILGHAYLLQMDPEVGERAAEGIAVIIKSGERAAQLTAQLLGFARRGKQQSTAVDVHATVREVVDLLGRTIDKRIHLTTGLQAERSHVAGDPTQIYQLLLNLCLNARDAMPQGGDLCITTRVAGSNIVVSVRDTGTGIAPDIRDRIFEPFFTTKAPQKGTGMGLAMVYGIAKNHSGTIHLESELGEGSVFHVTLPLCAGAQAPKLAQPAIENGRGRILVIDDEEVVRQVLSKMLQGLGYEARTAGDSRQAVQYFREHHREIDAVILDMIMPAMNGKDCFLALREIDPSVRAVFSSGYSGGGDSDDVFRLDGVEFLQKPYQIEQLAASLRNVMTRAASAH